MENIIYIIDFNDGRVKERSGKDLLDTIDNFIDEVSRIRKRYKYNKTTFFMTLYTLEQFFEANDYIEHYQSLSTDKYGPYFFSQVDAEIIRKINF